MEHGEEFTMTCKENPKHRIGLSTKYDSFYCIPCNVWLESQCGKAECPYCPGRPPTPKPVETKEEP